MIDLHTKFIGLVGPTASGKTSLGLRLAEAYGGEIVCADSRTIYRGMNIGTAKPSTREQVRVRHHLLDIMNPDQPFSAAEFKTLAEQEIAAIAGRGRVPFVVGGTGLYAYSVMYDYQFPAGPRTAERVQLEQRPPAELVAWLEREDPERAAEIDLQNPRRVIRALETLGQPRKRAAVLPPNALLLGIQVPPEELEQRIKQRTALMLAAGLVREVQGLVEKYGYGLEVLRSPGYAEIIDYLQGNITFGQAQDLINLHTRQLVKRQLTWLKRNGEIAWLQGDDAFERAKLLVDAFLA